jgi:galactose mutarotase-like enzyme
VKLLGGPWQLELTPERGGRITSLRLGGTELLDQGIGVDDPDEAGFVAAGARGWDEMVPTVEAAQYPGTGPWQGTELPDHGEAWRLPWTVTDETADGVVMECAGVLLPWALERRIQLGERAVQLTYVYKNLGRQPLYAFWCAHPLFRYEPDMHLDIGAESISLPAEGESLKTFLLPGSLDRVRLAWQSKAAIEVAWDISATPYIAVWMCNGDLGGYKHIAIEPATGGNDRPDIGAPPPLVGPGEDLRWWMEVRDRRK